MFVGVGVGVGAGAGATKLPFEKSRPLANCWAAPLEDGGVFSRHPVTSIVRVSNIDNFMFMLLVLFCQNPLTPLKFKPFV